jgi:enoyl-CoA hydratase
MSVVIHDEKPVCVIEINRPEVRNAVDGATAHALEQAFLAFDADHQYAVAVLCGAGGTFCAGADLKALAAVTPGSGRGNPLSRNIDDTAPMGPTRLVLGKPVIAAIDGYAVAGGMELALWCDLRVVEDNAVFGIFCRRFGVPLIDGGTVRLPRLIGMSRALDLILTGRPVKADEALQIGLANRVVQAGSARREAIALAQSVAVLPQTCMRNDRKSVLGGVDITMREALAQEFELGLQTLASGEARSGAKKFQDGAGRHGSADLPRE